MVLSEALRQTKLRRLVEAEGYASLEEMLAAAVADGVCPAICIAEPCDYTCDMEPDQDRGWCEACATNTVQSALVLARLI